MKQHILKTEKNATSKRLDKFLCDSLPDLSRSFVQDLIKDGGVLVNNKPGKVGYKLREEDEIIVTIPDLKEPEAKPENIPLDIVYEDKDLAVINKPQGMITHPASGVFSGTLVNAMLFHSKDSLSGINGVLRPGIVHRLDKETSGLIIICKNDASHNAIAQQIKDRTIKKYYYAIVHGVMGANEGTVNKPIGRHKTQRHKMSVIPNTKIAITHWKVIQVKNKYSLIECDLETGRTHQIRVHMAYIHHPIVGDKTYGKKDDKVGEMMLHSYKLIFKHPVTNKEITLETKLPKRFVKFLEG